MESYFLTLGVSFCGRTETGENNRSTNVAVTGVPRIDPSLSLSLSPIQPLFNRPLFRHRVSTERKDDRSIKKHPRDKTRFNTALKKKLHRNPPRPERNGRRERVNDSERLKGEIQRGCFPAHARVWSRDCDGDSASRGGEEFASQVKNSKATRDSRASTHET